MIYNINNKPI